MFNKFLAGAAVMAGAIVATTIITELKKNEAIKSAGKNFADGAKNLSKEIGKSAVNVTKTSVDLIKEQIKKAKESVENNSTDVETVDVAGDADIPCEGILSSDNGDIAVCAEGIKETDEIQQDKFIDADTELSDDEIIDDTSTDNKTDGLTDDNASEIGE